MIDLMAALIEYLEADAAVAALVSTRVYGEELPRSETDNQPRASIAIKHSGSPGGPGNADWMDLAHWRFDFLCYGPTPEAAGTLGRAVYSAMKDLQREVFASVLLHRANHSGGPVGARDPETDWPFVLLSFEVLAAETSAA